MKLNFDQPLFLLLGIPLLLLTLLPFFLYGKKKRRDRRSRIALIARLLACVLLVLSLSGLCVVKSTDKNTVILVADLSDSTRQVREAMEDFVRTAEKSCDEKTQFGLVTFGYGSEYELPLSENFRFSAFETAPKGNYTDIYSAVIRASALLPEGTNKRIVLLTDGKENIDKITEAAAALSSRRIRLDAVMFETGATEKEIQLSDVRVPDLLYSGEEFNITVTVESNVECDAVLRLTQDGLASSESPIHLSKGTNRYVFKEKADTTGITSYTAEVTANGDWLSGNNRIYSYVQILGKPKILIVDGTGSESHELVKILGDNVVPEVVLPQNAPATLADLRKYESVILMNTEKSSLPEGFDDLLDTYVRQLGRGLVTTGGSKSYILGGWADSALEKILPVNMTVKDEYNLSDVGIMLLIDNSGSMGEGRGSPLELAKEGGIKAADIVKPIDKIGVIAFSDNAVWISRMVSGTEKESVKRKIASIGPGGGTMYCTALQEAYKALKDSHCSVKSVIFLTDGSPADEDLIVKSQIIGKMAEENIAVTSIVVGMDFAPDVLKRISDGTGGIVTTVEDTQALPNIIYTEALKSLVGSYLCNQTFTPEVADYTAILQNVKALPDLDGYVMTQAKGLAYVELKASDDCPLLASWQYGLGKTVAFTSDLNGKWSKDLLASENGRTLLRNVVTWTLPSQDTGDGGSAEITRSGDKGILTLRTEAGEAAKQTTAEVLSPSGKSRTVELTPDGIGTYQGSFLLEEEGSYVAVIHQKDENGTLLLSKEAAMAVRYSDEYDMFAKDNGFVAECCKETGGRADWKDLPSILRQKVLGADRRTDLSTLLLIVGIVILMADIAVRRLHLNLLEKWKKARAARKAERDAKETVYVPAGATAAGAPVQADKTAPPAPSGKPAPGTAKPKEKTEEFKPEPKAKKAAKAKKEKAPEADAQDNISSLLKQLDQNKRKKM